MCTAVLLYIFVKRMWYEHAKRKNHHRKNQQGLYNGRDINITDEEHKRILTKCEKIDDVLNSLSLDRLIKFSSIASYHQVEARVTMEIVPQIKDIIEDMEDMEGMRPIEDESPGERQALPGTMHVAHGTGQLASAQIHEPPHRVP